MKITTKWTKAHLHCANCNKEVVISVPEDGWRRFKAGEKVQNYFPYMSEEDRDFLITGICAECQYELGEAYFADQSIGGIEEDEK